MLHEDGEVHLCLHLHLPTLTVGKLHVAQRQHVVVQAELAEEDKRGWEMVRHVGRGRKRLGKGREMLRYFQMGWKWLREFKRC